MLHPDSNNPFAISLGLLDRDKKGGINNFERILTILERINQSALLQSLLVAALTLLAAILRTFHLGNWSFWIEEYHTVNYTRSVTALQQILLTPRPFFFLLLKPFLLLTGINEWTARLLPAFLGVLSVPLLFWVAKKLYGLPVALLAASLLAISPWHLYWSQNARFYTLFLLLFNISLFTFYFGIERDDFRYILFSLGAMVLTVLTHGLGILLVLLFTCYYLLLKIFPFEKPAGLRLRNLLPFLLLPLVGYIFFEAFILLFTPNQPIYSILFSEFSKASGSSWIGYSNPYILLTATIYYIGTPLAFLALTGSLFLFFHHSRSGLLLSITAFVPLLLIMLLTFIASTANRYLFMTLPAWILLAAIAIQKLFHRARKGQIIWPWILGFLLFFLKDPVIEDILFYLRTQTAFRLLLPLRLLVSVLFTLAFFHWILNEKGTHLKIWGIGILLVLMLHPLVADSLYFAYQSGHRDNWKAAIETIREEKSNTDLVVTSQPFLVSYYLGEPTTDIHQIDLDTLLSKGQRVWIIQDYGLERDIGKVFDEWAQKNCIREGNWDQYTAGFVWKMRVELCNPIGKDMQLSR